MEPEFVLRFYIFTGLKLGDSDMKILQELEYVSRTSCSHATVCRGSEVFKAARMTSEMSRGLEHQKLP